MDNNNKILRLRPYSFLEILPNENEEILIFLGREAGNESPIPLLHGYCLKNVLFIQPKKYPSYTMSIEDLPKNSCWIYSY